MFYKHYLIELASKQQALDSNSSFLNNNLIFKILFHTCVCFSQRCGLNMGWISEMKDCQQTCYKSSGRQTGKGRHWIRINIYVRVSLRGGGFSLSYPTRTWLIPIYMPGDGYFLRQNNLFKPSGAQIRFQLPWKVHCISISVEKSESTSLD